ncbi:MAG: hypothetical protein GTO14_03330 [Anaerolineales bacterium]|nr:hypothetical protein [Anaerolineales bacterium]
MAEKKIYWICGFLKPEERASDFLKYGMKLNNVLKREAGRIPALRGFKFINLHTCSRRTFIRIWSDPSTYGIFWNSHGDQHGYPQADPDPRASSLMEEYRSMDLNPKPTTHILRGGTKGQLQQTVERRLQEVREAGFTYVIQGYEERRVKQLEDGRYEIEIKVAKLPKASPNLKFVAFISCLTRGQKKAWKQIMPSGAKFADFPEYNSTAPGARTGWIDTWIDKLKVPQEMIRSLVPKGQRSQLQGTQTRGLAAVLEGLISSPAYAATLQSVSSSRRVSSRSGSTGVVPPPGYRQPKGFTFKPKRSVVGIAGGGMTGMRTRFGGNFPKASTGGSSGIGVLGSRSGRRRGFGTYGTGITSDIRSRFRRTPSRRQIGGTGSTYGGRKGYPGGYGVGDPRIVNQIRSRFRTTPKRVPIGTRQPIGGQVSFGPVTITYSPKRRVVVPGRW